MPGLDPTYCSKRMLSSEGRYDKEEADLEACQRSTADYLESPWPLPHKQHATAASRCDEQRVLFQDEYSYVRVATVMTSPGPLFSGLAPVRPRACRR